MSGSGSLGVLSVFASSRLPAVLEELLSLLSQELPEDGSTPPVVAAGSLGS